MKAGLPTAQWALIGLVAIGTPLAAWGADYPPNTLLQVGPIALGLVAAFPMLRRWPLSTASVGYAAMFLMLHLFAARWTYSDVPYEAWGKAVGIDIDRTFGFTRNMFDRLVHFGFGVLAVPIIVEARRRYLGASRSSALVAAVMWVFAVSAAYEIFEWFLAVVMDPAAADAHNGQQGDVFDSPKDMAMAGLGSIITAGMIFVRPGESSPDEKLE